MIGFTPPLGSFKLFGNLSLDFFFLVWAPIGENPAGIKTRSATCNEPGIHHVHK